MPENCELSSESLKLQKQALKDCELFGRNFKEGKLKHCALVVEDGHHSALFTGSQPLYVRYGDSLASRSADLEPDDPNSMALQSKGSVEKTEGSADAEHV
ncbi:hypothetical protein DL764_003230 [Monosporascus ibericus]|uniref:Uncharacterized protein n=1 Tax=Monosporascus ibericus TaxID=155417 RepID=A0A4Q4TLX5_9PEZI|nr:hypothetical protein DL764_003230 [Monosporascus ibericus]